MEEVGCEMVENWLRSIGQVHYTQAFLDNGYDDLEVCKHIGYSDLDAIGVRKPEHRTSIYNAVETLRESKDAIKPLYFLLENPNSPSKLNSREISDKRGESKEVYTTSQGLISHSSSISYSTSSSTSGISDNASEKSNTLDMSLVLGLSPDRTNRTVKPNLMDKSCFSKSKVKDKNMINHVVLIHCENTDNPAKSAKNDNDQTESFEIEEIDSKENSGFSSLCSGESSKSSLDDVRSQQLSKANSCVSMDSENHSNQIKIHKMRASTSLMDEELLLGHKNNGGLKSSVSFSGYHGHSSKRRGYGWRPLSMAEPGTSGFMMMSAYGQSNRSKPPPLPRNPPPATGSYSDMSDSSTSHSAGDKRVPEIECLTEPEIRVEDDEPQISVIHKGHGQNILKGLGRFFSFKKSNKKIRYQPPYCDINAKDITMSDEDRIRLLIMVKEGRVTMDEAINTVKRYETEKKSGVHKNLNDYIPEENVKIPVATEKASRLPSPLKFLRSFSFTKGSKRKKFLRDLEFYYKEQEKRQKLIRERMSSMKIEDSNYSQPECCSNNSCSADRQTCRICSHGNSSHIRRNPSNQQRERTSDIYLDEHSNSRQFLKPHTYEHREFHSPHRIALNQYGYPSGYHPSCSTAYQDRLGGNYHEHEDQVQGVCSQCNPVPASHSRRKYSRSASPPVTMPHHSPYFQRDRMRHSFHSMPFRSPDHELVPYIHNIPYSNSFHAAPSFSAYDQHGYPSLPRRACSPSPTSYYHPGVVPHTILEERSPCVSTRSSMENLHMHSPLRMPIHAGVHPQISNPHFDDLSNNNPSPRRPEQHYINGATLSEPPYTGQHVHNGLNQNRQCQSKVDNAVTGQNLVSTAMPPNDSESYVPKRNTGLFPEDDENANNAELSTSDVTTESGCGASIRSSQQENYAQTCNLGRNPSTPESVEELCEKLGIQHLLEVFMNNGFETLELFKQIEEEDLDTLGISQPTDKAKVLTAVTLLPEDDYDFFTYTYRPVSDIYSTVNKPRSNPVSNNNTPVQSPSITTAEICASPLSQTRDSGCYVGVDNSNVTATTGVQNTMHGVAS